MAYDGVSTEELFVRYQGRRRVAIRNEIAARNIGLIHFVIKRFFPAIWNSQERDIAVSDASLGLLRAIDLFEPNRGFRFSTYATRAIFTNTVRWAKQRSKHFGDGQLSAIVSSATDGSFNDLVADARSSDPASAIGLSIDAMNHAIENLGDSNMQAVITMRFYQNMTLQQTGECMGLTKERVRQIEEKALHRLRKMLDPDWDGKPFKRKRKRRLAR